MLRSVQVLRFALGLATAAALCHTGCLPRGGGPAGAAVVRRHARGAAPRAPSPILMAAADEADPWDLSALTRRIDAVNRAESLQQRLETLEYAWVLVYSPDTDDEAVYSLEMEGAHVVLAFEDRSEAETYALALEEEEAAVDEGPASVQALDVEALVVTSRDADFRVGVVFSGDGERGEQLSAAPTPLIITSASSAAARAPPTITLVPDACFAGRTSADYVDPSEDPVWVLVHDEGTGDAQFFSMNLNGTSSVVCFKDEEAAQRCGSALQSKGTAKPTAARSVLLEDLLDTLGGDGEVEVCLVDEVIETVVDEEGEGDGSSIPGVVAADASDAILGSVPTDATAADTHSSVAPAAVRAQLERLWGSDGSGDAAAPA